MTVRQLLDDVVLGYGVIVVLQQLVRIGPYHGWGIGGDVHLGDRLQRRFRFGSFDFDFLQNDWHRGNFKEIS